MGDHCRTWHSAHARLRLQSSIQYNRSAFGTRPPTPSVEYTIQSLGIRHTSTYAFSRVYNTIARHSAHVHLRLQSSIQYNRSAFGTRPPTPSVEYTVQSLGIRHTSTYAFSRVYGTIARHSAHVHLRLQSSIQYNRLAGRRICRGDGRPPRPGDGDGDGDVSHPPSAQQCRRSGSLW